MTSFQSQSHAWVSRNTDLPEIGLRIHYLYGEPPGNEAPKGTILLLHGFPQTSYHYRHVIEPLARAGYRVIAPDYRGAGKSSKPNDDFRKSTMAADLFHLIHDSLGINGKIHVVGYDIGSMIAHAYATRFAAHVASVAWGECIMPGTTQYEERKTQAGHFHILFHSIPDLPKALLVGREELYLRYFFDRQAYNRAAISKMDIDEYTRDYAQPGAMRCAIEVYRAFEMDAKENLEWMAANGKCHIPALGLSGKRSMHAGDARPMLSQLYEKVETRELEEVGHYLAEEDPAAFVDAMLEWTGRYPGE